MRARAALTLAALLAAHAFLAIHTSWRSSVTVDEFAHLPAGITYWQQGTFALYHHNPPLAKLLAALPVLASHPVVDYSGSWARAKSEGRSPNQVEFGTEFMRANAARYFALFDRARLMIVALSVAGLWLVFAWARALWGAPGGLLAAALWTFEPNLIAHGGLVTTDMAATVTIFGAVFAFWRWLERRSALRAAVAGLALGLALLAKFSALLLLPLLTLLALLRAVSGPAEGEASPARGRGGTRGAWLLIPLLALLVLNAGYGFEGTGRRLGTFPFLSTTLTKPRLGGSPPPRSPYAFYQMIYAQRQNRFEGTWPGVLPMPVPEQFLLGLDEQRFESHTGLPGGGYAVALRGTIRREGWWWYYLYALAVKTPVALWFAGGIAIAAALLHPAARRRFADEAFWILPAAAILLTMSLMTGLDLGVRYVLPMLPFLFVGMARTGVLLGAGASAAIRRAAVIAVAASVVWLAGATLLVHPDELAYFNEVAGGPSQGYRHLLDSNLDWGQGLLELRRWRESRPPGEAIGLAYFGAVDPRLAGIPYWIPPRDPRVVEARRQVATDREPLKPGAYAVSVNFVGGLPLRVTAPDGTEIAADQNAFAYFRMLQPVGRAGRSIWIYQVSEADAARIASAWGRVTGSR
jgi:4-amino-4-deoxy-L-arabinose transferase-like glycosyltransferase